MNYSKTYENYSHDWHTPPEWNSWVKATLKTRKQPFDPCPADWSPKTHKDGLERPWGKKNYVNHPGGRGQAALWWAKWLAERNKGKKEMIWCAFNFEQLLNLRPLPMLQPGWVVIPTRRISFVWGGPTIKKKDKKGNIKIRRKGDLTKSPGNRTAFYTTMEPATPPVASLIIRTVDIELDIPFKP